VTLRLRSLGPICSYHLPKVMMLLVLIVFVMGVSFSFLIAAPMVNEVALILRQVRTLRPIAVFVGVVGCGILAVGFLFNLIF
jgi:uncharacterized membrane protein YraQ (UPF0718 family)